MTFGVTTPKRSQAAPEIPAIAEVLPGFDAAQRALASNEVRTALGGMSFSVEPLNPDEFAAYIRTETTRRAKMVKEAGIAPE